MSIGGGFKPQATKGSVSNLINGVSRQPENIRFPSQAEECVNHFPTVQTQCGRRNPLEILYSLGDVGLERNAENAGEPYPGLLATITIGDTIKPYVHEYKRDASEGYFVSLNGSTIQVFSFTDGEEKTVNINVPEGDTYLTSNDPSREFFCYTYKDTTFIVNRSVTTAMVGLAENTPYPGLLATLTQPEAGLSSSRDPECLINVNDFISNISGSEYDGTVHIGGNSGAFSVNTNGLETVDEVAAGIVSDLTSFVSGEGGTISRHAGIVHITHPSLEIQVEVKDVRAGTGIKAFTNEVQRTVDLPAYAPHGYRVKVTGSDNTQFSQDVNTADDVYYEFVADKEGEFTSGVWRETIASGIPYLIDGATMPHKLVRESDGTFSFGQIQWDARQVGDANSNPNPPFIGNTIHSIFLASSRFAILSEDSFILSQANEAGWFNFFRTTMLSNLASDPIQGIVPSGNVNKAYWGIQWNGEIIILGDGVDGAVSWSSTLSQENISIDTPTRFGSSPLVPPLIGGKSLFFFNQQGEYSLVYEYQLDPLDNRKDADNLTDYVSDYIPNDIIKAVGKEQDFFVALAEDFRSNLYPYNYGRKRGQLIQQAFHRWEFDERVTIYGIFISRGIMYLLFKYEDSQYFIGKMDLSIGATDTNYSHKCYLDMRIDETQVSSITFDAGTNKTTVTLPFNYSVEDNAPDRVIELRASCEIISEYPDTLATYPAGYVIPITSQTANTIILEGDWTSAQFYVGIPYASYYDPTKFHIWTNNTDGTGAIVDNAKSIQLKQLILSYHDTGAGQLQVLNRSDSAVVSTLDILRTNFDYSNQEFDSNTVYSGKFQATVIKPLDNYKLRLYNNTTRPSFWTSIDWYGEYQDANM